MASSVYSNASDDSLRLITEFVSHLYRVSDVTEDVDEWVKLFTEDAFVNIGGGPSTPDQISLSDLRKLMWKDIKTRKHTVTKVFPAVSPTDSKDLAFATFGSVKLELKTAEADGYSYREKEWSAYGQLREVADGVWRLVQYHVHFG